MRCKERGRNISQWLDGELKDSESTELEAHLSECLTCKQEVESRKKLDNLIQMANINVEPSSDFEATFWKKVYARGKEPWLSKLLKDIESLIPVPNLSQALAVLLIALFIGGTGGVVSAMNTITPEKLGAQQTSIKYLSGFQEFKGIPSSSVAASYLKTAEERNPR